MNADAYLALHELAPDLNSGGWVWWLAPGPTGAVIPDAVFWQQDGCGPGHAYPTREEALDGFRRAFGKAVAGGWVPK